MQHPSIGLYSRTSSSVGLFRPPGPWNTWSRLDHLGLVRLSRHFKLLGSEHRIPDQFDHWEVHSTHGVASQSLWLCQLALNGPDLCSCVFPFHDGKYVSPLARYFDLAGDALDLDVARNLPRLQLGYWAGCSPGCHRQSQCLCLRFRLVPHCRLWSRTCS